MFRLEISCHSDDWIYIDISECMKMREMQTKRGQSRRNENSILIETEEQKTICDIFLFSYIERYEYCLVIAVETWLIFNIHDQPRRRRIICRLTSSLFITSLNSLFILCAAILAIFLSIHSLLIIIMKIYWRWFIWCQHTAIIVTQTLESTKFVIISTNYSVLLHSTDFSNGFTLFFILFFFLLPINTAVFF